jgi:hypothetical protein
MTGRGLPPLFGAPWEREERIEVYSLSQIGRPEIDVDLVRRALLEAHEPLNNLFVDFVKRKAFQREAAMLARILESLGEFDKYIVRMGPTR